MPDDTFKRAHPIRKVTITVEYLQKAEPSDKPDTSPFVSDERYRSLTLATLVPFDVTETLLSRQRLWHVLLDQAAEALFKGEKEGKHYAS